MFVVRLEDGADPHDPETYWHADGDGALHRHWQWLERLAADAGAAPLSGFYSIIAADIEGYVDDDDVPTDLPPVRWSDPSDGLAAVQAVAAAVRRAESAPEREQVLAELAVVESGLAVAARAGVRFRLTALP